jgi:hypothetical protein
MLADIGLAWHGRWDWRYAVSFLRGKEAMRRILSLSIFPILLASIVGCFHMCDTCGDCGSCCGDGSCCASSGCCGGGDVVAPTPPPPADKVEPLPPPAEKQPE